MTKRMTYFRALTAMLLSASFSINTAYADSPAQGSLSQGKEPTVKADVLQQEQQASDKVNVNKADAMTLAKSLKGVGAKKAEAIIAFRKLHGPFLTAEELIQVKGLGKSFVAKNQQRIVFE